MYTVPVSASRFLAIALTCALGLSFSAHSEDLGDLDGELAPFLGEPSMETEQIFKGGRFPNITVGKDGVLLAVWGSGGVRLRRSEDGGKTWGEEIVITNPGFMGGGVTVDEKTWDVLAFVEEKHPPAKVKVFRSKDNGKTWKEQEAEIKPDSKGNMPSMHMNETGITLHHGKHAGRLIRPSRFYGPANAREHWPVHYTNAMFSDDGGKTWQTSEPFPENGTGEACIVELSDGTLYYNSRVHWQERPQNNRRRSAISDDGGATWKDFKIVEALPDGQQQRSYGLMGGLVRLSVKDKDILIFSNIETPNPKRERATVWASFDGGKTWPVRRLIHDGPSAYSSLTAGRLGTPSEGNIYLMFESAGAKVAAFNLTWLVEGKPTGDGEIPVWAKRK